MLNKITKSMLVLVVLLLLTSAAAFAAPMQQDVVCEEDYSVQADDWLSKLADKFYGDVFAYPAIFDATNAMAG